ncbi:MAG: Lrp/AsnC family transcriptional regulator [Candidatus Bathyarchaeia archaeon]
MPRRKIGDMFVLDEVDRKILMLLQEDARRSFKDMAGRVGVSEATVFVRVKKLIKNGVIKAFRADLDSKAVGKATVALVLLKAEPSLYNEALKELARMEDVYEIYDVTGPYYAVLKVRTSSPEELASAIDRIGAVKGVLSTETAMVLRAIKEEKILKV